jgi:hypothetical protein
VSRNRRSAKAAGTRFETLIARGLAEKLGDDRVERRARVGAGDQGDIAGVRLHGQRVVLECKDEVSGKVLKLPEWTDEAHKEAVNDGALVGLVVSKRSGTTDPMKQWIHGTVADLVAILTGVKQ